jgi:outer membrane receptor protein involved in Fe transport
MNSKVIISFLLVILIPCLLVAGTTGKIKGKVTMKDSGEPSIGANIILEGTSMGASTDVEGAYVILNVPPGTYTVKASMVGYHATPVTNVKVNVDLTTEINFQMIAQDVELPAVQIVAERPLVNKSATNAVRVLTSDELQAIPIRGLTGVFALQPGVVLQDNNLYIRGGRSDEVGYYVEGASSRNVLNGQNAVTVIPEAIEEFQIQAGGYNAEYGGSNAGIVRQQLRSGTSKYKASFQIETDKFSSQGSKSLGSFSYGYWNSVLTLSGPVPILEDKLKFFIAGENQFFRDPSPSFWHGFEYPNVDFPDPLVDGPGGGNPGDTLFAGGGVPASSVNSKHGAIKIPEGNIPGKMQNRWTANGTIVFDYNPFIVRVGAALSFTRNRLNELPVQNILNLARQPITDNSTGLYNLKFTHFVTPKMFYEVNLNYFDNRFKRYDPQFEDRLMSYGDSIAAAKYGYTYWSYADPSKGISPPDYRFYGFPFARAGQMVVGGTTSSGQNYAITYLKQKQNYMGGTVDFTNQTGNHEVKAGLSYQRYTVRQYRVGRLDDVFLQFFTKPDSARDPEARVRMMRSSGIPNNFGYDAFGNEIEGGFDGPKHPNFFAFYVQDKIEFNDLIVNAGLRFDIFDNNDKEFKDPMNPGYDVNNIYVDEKTLKDKEAFKAVSPRLGLSFPVTDRTVFHLQYGKFIQSPQLNTIYIGGAELARIFSGRNFINTPVGFGVDPERTTQYEIGFTQQISDFASFDMTGFYKDIKGQIQIGKIITQSGAVAQSYNVLENGDFATTKGIEFTLTLRRVERLQVKVNYTLSDAQGTGSNTTTAISSIENGTIRPTVISPLTFNQTHRGSFNLDYRFTKGEVHPIVEQLGANVLFTFNSGHNFTKVKGGLGQTGPEDGGILYDGDPRNRRPDEPVNASTTPWNFNLDLRIDKTVTISDMFDLNIYFYIQNMLNTDNVINVYGRTGNADDDGFLTNPDLSGNIVAGQGPGYVALYKDANLANRQHYWRNQGGDLLGAPRQIRFGVRIEY